MNRYTSDFIFSLADKYQIPLDSSKQAEFLDESYLGFCTDYKKSCEKRDINLKQHLIDEPNLLRTFLPWRQHIFNTVFQTQWYYDELIIYDPIFFEIDQFKTGNIEYDKIRLRNLLSFLNSLKDSINEGFLLFGSYDTFSTNNKQLEENKFETLLSIPEIREECDKLVHVYKMESKENIERPYFQVRCDYRDKRTLFTVVQDFNKIKKDQKFEIWYELIDSSYTKLTIEEVKQGGFYDRAYNGFKEDYPFEIKEILKYIDISSSIKTPVLFDCKLDELVLSNISYQEKNNKSKANDYYKLFLPFINNIPANRLFDIRTKMPNAFLDFRNQMFEIIYDFEKSGVEPEMLEFKIKQKINPLIRKLETEMTNSVTKAKIMTAGLPIITGVGTLGLWSLGIDISKYIALLLGGVNIASLTALTNYLTEKKTGQANSMYYLWKLQQQK